LHGSNITISEQAVFFFLPNCKVRSGLQRRSQGTHIHVENNAHQPPLHNKVDILTLSDCYDNAPSFSPVSMGGRDRERGILSTMQVVSQKAADY
jgi:hypothetical protein